MGTMRRIRRVLMACTACGKAREMTFPTDTDRAVPKCDCGARHWIRKQEAG